MTDLEAVARTYIEAADRHEFPTKAVMEAFNLPRSTASRHVADARKRGLIDIPALVGRPSDKTWRVAEALGVDRDELVRVLIEHAEGDLRVTR